jgi:hypothetical protein
MVAVEPDPRQGEVADGEVKLLTSARGFTLNGAVLLETIEAEHPNADAIEVIVTVYAPEEVSIELGIENTPLDVPISSDALPEEVPPPLRL